MCSTHTLHIHRPAIWGSCEAILKPRSSPLSSSPVLGVPGLLCRPWTPNLPRTTGCCHLDHIPVELQKASRSWVNSQPGAHCCEWSKLTGQVLAHTHSSWAGKHPHCSWRPPAPPLPLSSTLLPAMPEVTREWGPLSRSPSISPHRSGVSSEPAAVRKEVRLEHAPTSAFTRFASKLSARFGRQRQQAGTRGAGRR